MKNKIHTQFFFFLAACVVMFVIFAPQAMAVELPCVPSDPNAGNAYQNDVFNCVNRLYRIGLVASTVAAVFMIILAGYLYIFSGGSSSRVGTAKSFVSTSLLGLAVLIVGYLVLQQINPSILEVKNVSFGQLGYTAWSDELRNGNRYGYKPGSGQGDTSGGGGTPGSPGTGGGGDKGSGSGTCTPLTSGAGSEDNLYNTCFGGNAKKASSIANIESKGSTTIKSGSDICKDNNSVSIGLFQINISANYLIDKSGQRINCPDAFNKPFTKADADIKDYTKRSCYVKSDANSQALYKKCVELAQDPEINIKKACEISQNGKRWGQWGANRKCNFTR